MNDLLIKFFVGVAAGAVGYYAYHNYTRSGKAHSFLSARRLTHGLVRHRNLTPYYEEEPYPYPYPYVPPAPLPIVEPYHRHKHHHGHRR